MRLSLPYLAFLLVLVGGFFFLRAQDRAGDDASPQTPHAGDSSTGESNTGETAARIAAAFDIPPANRIPSDKTNNTGEPWGDYVGSDACARCHQEEFAKWKLSFHSKTLYDADQHSIIGDFKQQYDWEYNEQRSAHKDPGLQRARRAFEIRTFTKVDDITGDTRHFMDISWRRVEDGGLPENLRGFADTYGNTKGKMPAIGIGPVEVLYAFGNRKHQPYVARWPDGTHWVLPIYWNDVDHQWLYAGFRSYVDNCGNCHVTGIRHSDTGTRLIPMTLVRGVRPGLYLTEDDQWADGAVGCENCHGPGRDHVRTVERVGSDKYSALIKSGEMEPTIWDAQRGKFKHTQDNCGRCHNYFTESACAWLPTPQGYTRDPFQWPNHEVEWQKYHDGSEKSPCVLVDTYRTSKMHESQVACSDCHDPHGTSNWADLTEAIEDNSLCIKCHTEFESIEAQTQHSFHKADSHGNRCVECHMPRHMVFTNGEQMMSKQVYSHAFSVPTGRRRDGGPPSSCNICHVDRDHAWTRQSIKSWWGPDADTDTVLPLKTANSTKK